MSFLSLLPWYVTLNLVMFLYVFVMVLWLSYLRSLPVQFSGWRVWVTHLFIPAMWFVQMGAWALRTMDEFFCLPKKD